MSTVIDIKDFPNCCRCCLEIGTGKMYLLFDACLVQMLNSIVPGQISKEDGYPQQVCYRCVMKVSMAYRFIQTVMSSQQVLLISKDMYHNNVKGNMAISTDNIIVKNEEANDILHKLEKHVSIENIFNSKNIPIDMDEDNVVMVTDNAIVPKDEEVNEILHKLEKHTSDENLFNSENIQSDINDDSQIMETVQIEEMQDVYIVSEETTISCANCDKIFKNEVDCKIHSLSAHRDNCLVCNERIKTSCTSSKIKSRRVCDTCSNCRPARGRNKKTIEKPKCYLCSYCGKTFKVRTSLLKHLRYHKSKNLLQCKYCGKSFLYTKTLDAHMVTHLGIKAFKCKLCNARFTQRGSLNKHQILHTGIKPYHCTVCSKSFVRKSIYKAHLRIHTGEKPYKCSICNKSFAWPNSLRAHQRCHDKPSQVSLSNENVLKCTICPELFTSSPSYKAHLKKHPRVLKDEFKCRGCDLFFASRELMLQHYKIEHSVASIQPDVTCTMSVHNLITNTVNHSII